MTDRIKGLVVAFEEDIHDDIANEIINAIKMFKGVVAVKPSIANSDDWMNREQVRAEYRKKLWEALK